MENNNILVYTELTVEYGIRNVSLQLISKAFELKQKLNNSKIIACILGPDIDYSLIIRKLEELPVDDVIIASSSELSEYNYCYHPEVFTGIVKKYEPSIVLIGATVQGKEIASYCASKLETGLTADCTGLNITNEGCLLSTRPTFGGQLTADILCKTRPQMATVQENIFKIVPQPKHNVNTIYENIQTCCIENRLKKIFSEVKTSSSVDVTKADIIVAGGLGACKDNGFELIKKLAQKLNAAVAGSREAFEKGYITKSQQIGQTGKTVSPKIYIAIGISGANQHLTAIKNSGKIIAINKDVNAPIFEHSDIAIKGDLFEILPELINKIGN